MDLKVSLPEIYQIEVSSTCNLKCTMCPTRFFPRKDKQALIHPDLIRKMISRGDFDSSYFTELQMSGEPLLHPSIELIIDLIKSTGVAVGLSTNGWFIQENINAISKLDYLTISFDSVNKYNEIRISKSGKKRDVCDFIRDIYICIKLCKSVDIQCVELPGWEEEFFILQRLFGEYTNVSVRSVANSNDDYFDPDNGSVINTNLCINPWYSVSVQCNGNVVPCCYAHGDEMIYGNLWNHSLSEIWSDVTIEKFRESHMQREYISMCKKCHYRSPALLYHHNMYHNGIKRERLCQK